MLPPFQTPRRQKRLFCRYYDGNRNPRYILGPVKQEDEWDKPRIVRFLDIISDEEIETVKELAKPRVNALPLPSKGFLAFGILNSMCPRCKCVWLSPLERKGVCSALTPCLPHLAALGDTPRKETGKSWEFSVILWEPGHSNAGLSGSCSRYNFSWFR